MKPTIIVGLNCSHDAAAAICVNGLLVSAVAEERLTRVKHQEDFPVRALDYCLKEAGLDRSASLQGLIINQLPPTTFEVRALEHFRRGSVDKVIVNPSHHYLHACYAEMLTDRRPLIILVADGSGYSYAEHQRRRSPFLGDEPVDADMWESLSAYYVNENGEISLLLKDWGQWRDHRTLRFPSLGHMYGVAAQHVFGSWKHAGKLMGLAPFGDPTGHKPIVTLTETGVEVDTNWILEIPPIPYSPHFEDVPIARDLAARVQAELERGMMHLCVLLRERTGCQTICLTGGVALNSVFNGRLAKEGLFEKVIASPASHDSGTAIGAAAYGYKQISGKRLRFRDDPEFLGHDYRDREIADALADCPDVTVERIDNPVELAAKELAAGRTVGWFEGGSEFGPRALGHRSILADPRAKDIKERLNSRIKFRESFRPYAAAVLEERCAEWFETSVESPHMLMVSTVKPEKRDLIPGVLHVDNTSRLQTVRRNYPGSLRKLIEAFATLTGIPMLLNTSLNILGQPMSETPKDALDCLVRSGLDILYCGDYRVERRASVASIEDPRCTRALPSEAYYLVCRYDTVEDSTRLSECWIRQGNRQLVVSEEERDVLMRVTGKKTISEIVGEAPQDELKRVTSCVQSLCDRGVLHLKLSDNSTAHPEA